MKTTPAIQPSTVPPTTPASAAELEAWKVVRRNIELWWAQMKPGEKCRPNKVCILAATEPYAGQTWLCCIMQAKIAEMIGGFLPYDVWAWNDAPGRTKAEVLAVIDSIIAQVE